MSEQHVTITLFDRMLGALQGLPDVVETKPTTIVATMPVVGMAQTYIIQTVRQRAAGDADAKSRDTIFLQTVSAEGSIRIVLPAEVADAIARQRDALGSKNRKRAARQEAARRKEAGITPAFLKKRGKG